MDKKFPAGTVRLLVCSLLPPSLFFWALCGAPWAADIRHSVVSPQEVLSSVNPGGPEDWPADQAITTRLPEKEQAKNSHAPENTGGPAAETAGRSSASVSQGSPSASQQTGSTPAPQDAGPESASSGQAEQSGSSTANSAPAVPGEQEAGTVAGAVKAPAPDSSGEKEKTEEQEVVYVDKDGKPVPPPPDPEALQAEAEKLIGEHKYEEALPVLEQLKTLVTDPAKREFILYLYSDALNGHYRDKPVVGYEAIVSATNEAMNANLRSPMVVDALYRLGMINLEVGNLVEAEGFFKAMHRRFPENANVATGLQMLGDALAAAGQHKKAEEFYRLVIDQYPQSQSLKKASVGLCRVLYHQGRIQEAAQMAEFINLRWARYYLDDPQILKDEAEIALAGNNPGGALEQFWLFLNLLPEDPGNADLLVRMGDLYFSQGKTEPGVKLFREVRKEAPDTEAGAIALLRLTEGGIYDTGITYDRMSRLFGESGEKQPQKVYSSLMEAYPEKPFGRLARLKYAMWQFRNKQYIEAVSTAADFIDRYPENPHVPVAKDLVWNAFLKEKEHLLLERNYSRLLSLWESFPLVRARYGEPDPPLRHALAEAMLERGARKEAFAMLAEFLRSPKDPVYGEAAFVIFFNHYLQTADWNAVLDLGNLVRDWKMSDALRSQTDYALALAAENLGLGSRALRQWRVLADRKDIPVYQRAYANYFLARDAEKRRDVNEAYRRNKTVLTLFTRLRDERSERSEPERIREAVAALMDITEVANRIPESLSWLDQYRTFVKEDSPEYIPLRFREARLYRKLNDVARARAILEDIVRKEADSAFGKAAASELRTLKVSRDLQNYIPGRGGSPEQGKKPEAEPAQ